MPLNEESYRDPIRIRVAERDGLYYTEVSGGESNIPPFYSDASASEIRNFVSEYRRRLHQARRSLGDANPDCTIANASRFFQEVHTVARHLFFMICRERARELTSLFEQRHALLADADPEATPYIVELEHPAAVFFPLEIFPLADIRVEHAATTVPELLKQARCFVGMSAIIRRVRWTGKSEGADPDVEDEDADPEIDQDRTLSGRPLSVKVFYDASLEGARSEVQFFMRIPRHIAVKGPWPAQYGVGDRVRGAVTRIASIFKSQSAQQQDGHGIAAQTVARHMRDPTLCFDGQRGGPVDQVQHFCCHCGPSTAHPGSQRLRVRGNGGNELRLENDDTSSRAVDFAEAACRWFDAAYIPERLRDGRRRRAR